MARRWTWPTGLRYVLPPLPSVPTLPGPFVKEAFRAAGERHYLLSRIFYSAMFGAAWRYAVVGFAYIKCLDNAVDENADATQGLAALEAQHSLLRRVYAAVPIHGVLPIPDRFGYEFCRYDRAVGARWRPVIEAIIETMEFDVQRRHQVLPRPVLDAYFLKMGKAMIEYTAYFVSSKVQLSPSFVHSASRAYLYSDTLMDLEHDLRLGIINIPAEDIESFGVDLRTGGDALRAWMAKQSVDVEQYYSEAFRETARLDNFRIRVLSRLYLSRKRNRFHRFLQETGIRRSYDSAIESQGRQPPATE